MAKTNLVCHSGTRANIIERAGVLEMDPGVIRAETIEPWLKMRPVAAGDALAGKPLAEIEKQVILTTLQSFKGHRMKTAHALGIGVRTLGMKLKKWKEEGGTSASAQDLVQFKAKQTMYFLDALALHGTFINSCRHFARTRV